jgi:hypothetical protein
MFTHQVSQEDEFFVAYVKKTFFDATKLLFM